MMITQHLRNLPAQTSISTTTKVDLVTSVTSYIRSFAATKNTNMKIVVTGSLGNISKPLTEELVKKAHSVTVISSNPEKKKNIKALGATAAIGSIEDVQFLTKTFAGADAVYCMEPPTNFFDQHLDLMKHINNIANNYAQAIQQSAVKKVVHLSSIGAHRNNGVGMLSFHYNVEKILSELPSDVSITFLRPVGFYYNLLAFIHAIKTQGAIVSNYGGDGIEPWVSPFDIAEVIAEEITSTFNGRKTRYIASDELSPNEIAKILGAAIGKPDLKWLVIPDEQLQNGLIDAGFNKQIAKGFVEMNASRINGILYEDYFRNRPALGKVKMKDFAKNFAAAFSAQ